MQQKQCMSTSPFDPAQTSSSAPQACVLYGALHKEANPEDHGIFWRMTPKFSHVQKLAEFQATQIGNPRDFWAYKDEDFVGFIATLAMRRGGEAKCSTVRQGTFDRYRAVAA